MSRTAKFTLLGALAVSGLTVWGVHYMQIQERMVMHRGVERDEARQAEKRRQRALELTINQEKEKKFQQMQPTKGWLSRGGAATQTETQTQADTSTTNR